MLEKVFDIFMIIFIISAILLMLFIVLYTIVAGKIAEKAFQNSVLFALKSKATEDEIKEIVCECYITYKSKAGTYLDEVQLLSRFREKIEKKKIIKEEDYIFKFCLLLRKIEKQIINDRIYNNEKLEELLSNKMDDELRAKIKLLFMCIKSYDDGRISQLENENKKLDDMVKKRTRKL